MVALYYVTGERAGFKAGFRFPGRSPHRDGVPPESELYCDPPKIKKRVTTS
jgi:hypothetical protein